MAGSSVTITKAGTGNVKRIAFAWTSDDTTGAASGATTFHVDGRIVRLTTDPGAAAPTDNYDITLTDELGVDVLQGLGANRDTANTEDALIVYSATSNHPYTRGPLTFVVENAGNSKTGTAYVFYLEA